MIPCALLVTLHQTPSSYGKLPFKCYFRAVITYCDFVAISVGDVTRFEFIVFAFPEAHFPLDMHFSSCVLCSSHCYMESNKILQSFPYVHSSHCFMHPFFGLKNMAEFVHDVKNTWFRGWLICFLVYSSLFITLHKSLGQVHPICLFNWSG